MHSKVANCTWMTGTVNMFLIVNTASVTTVIVILWICIGRVNKNTWEQTVYESFCFYICLLVGSKHASIKP